MEQIQVSTSNRRFIHYLGPGSQVLLVYTVHYSCKPLALLVPLPSLHSKTGANSHTLIRKLLSLSTILNRLTSLTKSTSRRRDLPGFHSFPIQNFMVYFTCNYAAANLIEWLVFVHTSH